MKLTPIQILKICEYILAEAKTYPPHLKRRAQEECESAYRVFAGRLQYARGTTIRLDRRKRA